MVSPEMKRKLKKIEYLKTKYHQEKNKSSGSAPSTWEFFESMSRIFHQSHYYNQENCISLDSLDQGAELDLEEIENNESRRRGRKRKSLVALDNFEKRLKQSFEKEKNVTIKIINKLETLEKNSEENKQTLNSLKELMQNIQSQFHMIQSFI